VLTRTDPIALVRNLASPHPVPEQVLISEPSMAQSLAGLGLQLGLLALFGAAAWGASLGRAAVMSVAVVFALTPLGAYYWVMVIVMPLAGGRREVLLGLMLFAAALYAHLLWVPAQVAAPVRYFAISWAMALLLALWLLPAARAGAAAWRSSWPGLAPPKSRRPLNQLERARVIQGIIRPAASASASARASRRRCQVP
jgi:hypothetical protein